MGRPKAVAQNQNKKYNNKKEETNGECCILLQYKKSKGFSEKEILESGILYSTQKKYHIKKTDRKSCYKNNIDTLQALT
jgi:hypothetical protein